MEISGATNIGAQEIAVNKAQAGFDVLTKTLAKAEQNEVSEQQNRAIAQQTGKGMHIDIKA